MSRISMRPPFVLLLYSLAGATTALPAQHWPGVRVGDRWTDTTDEGILETTVVATQLGIVSTLAGVPHSGALHLLQRRARRRLRPRS